MKTLNHKDKFEVGDKVKCLAYHYFIDGTRHHKGDVIEVNQNHIHYFNFFNNDYKKI